MVQLKFLSIIIIAFFITGAAVQPDKAKKAVMGIKEIENSLAKVSDSLYAGKYEVSNFLYGLFESDLKANNKTDDLKIAQVDSLNWRDKLAYNEPYVEYYYRHPAYRDYPVVNISFEAANLFCEWLTNKYNDFPKRKFKKVIFRLPTSNEWSKATRGNAKMFAYPWGSRLIMNDKYMCNFAKIGDENITFRKDLNTYEVVKNRNSVSFSLSDAADITAPVNSYMPNSYGLYNVCGNVAEMISDKGKTRGGSYKNSGWDVRIDAVDNFEKSAADVGFRYFMEIIEK